MTDEEIQELKDDLAQADFWPCDLELGRGQYQRAISELEELRKR